MCGIVAHFSRAVRPEIAKWSQGWPENSLIAARMAGPMWLQPTHGSRSSTSRAASNRCVMTLPGASSFATGRSTTTSNFARGWRAGHVFKSQSDSEAVLHLYDELGSDCATRLDGMFAFFASNGDSFVAARDPFGIKPLYWGRTKDGGVLFGSELKAVAEVCTTFETLPPGATIGESGDPRRWFRPNWEIRVGSNSDLTAHELEKRLERAVVKRLMSDVPLGVFLSEASTRALSPNSPLVTTPG